jgi:hypothetical protein
VPCSTILDSAVVKFNTVLLFEKGTEYRYNATEIHIVNCTNRREELILKFFVEYKLKYSKEFLR